MKKLSTSVLALTLFVALGVACMPRGGYHKQWQRSGNQDNDKIVVETTNRATVISKTEAVAVSGGNEIEKSDDHNVIVSGEAKAVAKSSNVVNTNVVVISQN